MKFDLRPMGLGEMMDRGLRIYLSNLAPLLTVSLVVLVPLGLLGGWLASAAEGQQGVQLGSTAVTFLLSLLLNSLLQGALLQAVSDIYLDGKTEAGTVLGRAAARFLPLVVTGLLTAFFVLAGFVLLIIPGFIALAGLCVAQCAVMLEKHGAMESIKRSWQLTKDHRGRAFSTLFAAGLIIGVLNWGAMFALVMLLHPGAFLLQVLTTILSAVFQPFAVVVTILLYYDLRIRKEAFDLQVLAREMGVTPAATPAP